jgi:hypothetical protein
MNATQKSGRDTYPTLAAFIAKNPRARVRVISGRSVVVTVWRCFQHGLIYGADGRFEGMTGPCQHTAAAERASERAVRRMDAA